MIILIGLIITATCFGVAMFAVLITKGKSKIIIAAAFINFLLLLMQIILYNVAE